MPLPTDAPSVIKACQALSGELALDKLLVRLMDILVEHAGAERGALVWKRGDTPTVAAELGAPGGTRLSPHPAPLVESPLLSPAIATHVMRTRQTVLLADASSEGAFTGDVYVTLRRPRAVLCAPLVQETDVRGALYLENNLVAGTFTPERAELLNVLCGQVAISIDNAQRYADLEREVHERTRALEAAHARLPRFEREMAGGFAHEMRNTLAGAKLMLGRVYSAPKDATAWSSCLDNSGRLKDIFLNVRDHLPKDALEVVAGLLKETNGSEAQLHEILRCVRSLYGADIQIDSVPGRSTTFRVFFPRDRAKVHPSRARQRENAS
jgi:histidine kinase